MLESLEVSSMDVAARATALDLVRGLTVNGRQIVFPRSAHRVEQFDSPVVMSRVVASQNDEAEGFTVMRCGSQNGILEGPMESGWIDGIVGEGANGAPGRDCCASSGLHRLLGAEGEEVFLERAHDVLGGGAVVGDHQMGEPTKDGHGRVVEFSGGQVDSGCDLVGDRDNRHLQRISEIILAAGVVVEHVNAAGSDGNVGDAQPPGTAHRVGDDDTHGDAGAIDHVISQLSSAGIGIDGKEDHRSLFGVAGIDPGRREHQAV